MSSAPAPASMASSSVSTTSCRTRRPWPAPRALRTPNSVRRAVNLATSSPPVLAQATIINTLTSTRPSAIGWRRRSRASDTPLPVS